MAGNFLRDRSFIATLDCTTPGWEGFLDTCELSLYGTGGYPVPNYKNGWLTLTNYPLDRERRTSFWFGCWEYEGQHFYEVRTNDLGPGAVHPNLRLGWSHNNYIGLYPAKGRLAAEWQLQGNDGQMVAPSRIAVDTLWGVSLKFTHGSAMRAYARRQVRNYWYSFLNEAEGPTLRFKLSISQVGVGIPD
ncbi:hypothetical protein [Pseudomonas rubra]|uniref:Uncharacterized protein n=1 Tax=Pseudomonas rubra TaxID=2942627 RepID=A0ABT5P4M6_9PSED|nr:hypothetical protein [Pseudomonas rubra]MDD1013241.1 hypothetical protein [Pseudomonas rubra]MDD1037546.1 hypothetical protein [Pseudomonas rubra]MDD1155566.1 hypothetical protein [Pseudomonas rubra]